MSAHKKLEELDNITPLDLVNQEIYLEDIKSRTLDLEDELSSKKKQLGVLKNEYQELKAEIAKINEDSLEYQRKQAENFKAKIQNLNHKIEELEKKKEQTKLKDSEELFSLKKAINEFRIQKKQKESEFEQVNRQYLDTKSLLENSLNLLKDSREKCDHAQFEYEEKLKEKIQEEKNLQELNARISKELIQKELLQEEIENLHRDKEYNQELAKTLEESTYELKSELHTLEERVKAYKELIKDKEEHTALLEERKTESHELQAHIKAAKAQLSELKTQKANFRKKIEKAQNTFATEEAKREKQEERISDIEATLKFKEELLIEINEKLSGQKQLNSDLENKYAHLNEDIKKAVDVLNAKGQETKEFDSQILKQTQNLHSIESELNRKNNALTSLVEKYDHQEVKVSEQLTQINDLKSKIENLDLDLKILENQKNEAIERSKKEIQKINDQLQALGSDYELKKEFTLKEQASLLAENNSIQDSISKSQKELEVLNKKVSIAQEEVSSLALENKVLTQQIQNKEELAVEVKNDQTLKANLEVALTHLQAEVQAEEKRKLEVSETKDRIIQELSEYKAIEMSKINEETRLKREEIEKELADLKAANEEYETQSRHKVKAKCDELEEERRNELQRVEETELFKLQEKIEGLKSKYLNEKEEFEKELRYQVGQELLSETHPEEFRFYIEEMVSKLDVDEDEYEEETSFSGVPPKVKRFWRNVFLATSVLSIIAYIAAFKPKPVMNAYQKIHDRFVRTSDNEVFVNDFRAKREARYYHPVKSTGLRETVLDNVLHTTNYASYILDSEYQNQYIIGLNEFILTELALHEDSVIKILEIETNLLKELLRESKNILLDHKDEKLALLAKAETAADEKLYRILLTQDNLKRFKRFKDNFYLTYVNKKMANQ